MSHTPFQTIDGSLLVAYEQPEVLFDPNLWKAVNGGDKNEKVFEKNPEGYPGARKIEARIREERNRVSLELKRKFGPSIKNGTENGMPDQHEFSIETQRDRGNNSILIAEKKPLTWRFMHRIIRVHNGEDGVLQKLSIEEYDHQKLSGNFGFDHLATRDGFNEKFSGETSDCTYDFDFQFPADKKGTEGTISTEWDFAFDCTRKPEGYWQFKWPPHVEGPAKPLGRGKFVFPRRITGADVIDTIKAWIPVAFSK